MTTLTQTRTSLTDLELLSVSYEVPLDDVLLIAINLFGVSSPEMRRRVRLTLRLGDLSWMVIVPLNRTSSPFQLRERVLFLGDMPVAEVERIDSDDAVGGYFRDGGRAATLNPNARSRCVGCAFCPNTLEAAADPRLDADQDLHDLVAALAEQHPRGDLTELREVTISTGCFEREAAAVAHLRALRRVLTESGIGARIGFLTSVIHSGEAFDTLGAEVAPFVLRLTIECFTRRDLMLKASKAVLTPAAMPGVLSQAKAAGLDTSFTYIVGLDPLEAMDTGLDSLAGHVTEFPNIQVFQAHNPLMECLRVSGAETLAYYLEARSRIERILGPTGLRPAAWECYRPLWYTAFAGEPLEAGA